jgi:membrane protease YdiL (CAAX protease family)
VSAIPTLVLWTTVATTAFVVAPPVDEAASFGPGAVPLGVLVGLGLFAMLARRRIHLGAWIRNSRRRVLARCAVLVTRSAYEEALWRGLLLGALLPLGRVQALLVGSTLFAAAHVPRLGARAATHLWTGAAFGGIYLLTGALEAAIAAHAAYNVAIGLALLAETCPVRPIDAPGAAS